METSPEKDSPFSGEKRMPLLLAMQSSVENVHSRAPDAAQHEVVRCARDKP
jgi:hypothetical protein